LQIGPFINYCGRDSLGVQVGLINIRAGNPWYSTVIPILAVRTKRKKASLDKKVE
jgi:hypothetical protein